MSDSLRPHGLKPTRLLCLWDSPGENTGVGCHFLLLEIFLSQGLNLCLLCRRRILYPPNHFGSTKFLALEHLHFKRCLKILIQVRWVSFVRSWKPFNMEGKGSMWVCGPRCVFCFFKHIIN